MWLCRRWCYTFAIWWGKSKLSLPIHHSSACYLHKYIFYYSVFLLLLVTRQQLMHWIIKLMAQEQLACYTMCILMSAFIYGLMKAVKKSLQEIKLGNSRRLIQSQLRFQWWNFIHGVAFFWIYSVCI